MKWRNSLAVVFLSLGLNVHATDSIFGTCTGQLTGNDATNHIFSKIDALASSEILYSFEINALTRHEISQRFVRIVPYADDVNRYRKYQVALFENDKASLIDMNKEHIDEKGDPDEDFIPYVKEELPGRAIMAIGYGGKNQQGGAQVTVDVYGTKAGISPTKNFLFDSEGKTKFKVKYDVVFDYQKFKGDGILGIFSGDVKDKDFEQVKTKTHKVEVNFECVAFTVESTVDGERSDTNKSNDPVQSPTKKSEFDESEIIRTPKVIRE